MSCWDKVCGAEKMTDNSEEIKPDTIPHSKRRWFLQQWVGRGGPPLLTRTSLPGMSNLLLNILTDSEYLLPLKNVNF